MGVMATSIYNYNAHKCAEHILLYSYMSIPFSFLEYLLGKYIYVVKMSLIILFVLLELECRSIPYFINITFVLLVFIAVVLLYERQIE